LGAASAPAEIESFDYFPAILLPLPNNMTKKTICVLAGDGVGPEVTQEAIKILDVIQKHTDLSIEYQHKQMGGCAIDSTGNPLPDDTLTCAKAADAVLLGAVGGPKWGTGKVRPEQGIPSAQSR
jgi:3-isopropylmalate dehydrogenase